VKDPDADDYKKLTCAMQYLMVTQNLTLTIKPDNHPNWWEDSSNAVHLGMHSRSGIYMMLGKGVTYGASKKQNLTLKALLKQNLWLSMTQWGEYCGHITS